MALNLLRNARLFVSTVSNATGLNKSNTWELPVLSDFTFTQANETQDITVSEAGATPVRGAARFNTALNPVEWSFGTYMRPYKSYNVTPASGNARSIDRIMWHGLLSDNTSISWSTAPFATSTSEFKIEFSDSNQHKFLDLYFYIKADNQWYRINKVQVNQAEIDFSIESIGTTTWSGFGSTMDRISAPTFTTGANAVIEFSSPVVVSGNTVSTTGTVAEYVVQRYTTLGLLNLDNSDFFAVPITGGTLTINNNMTYLTPENLGQVNQPYAAITGSREISGSLTCYLKTGGTFDSGDLFNSLLTSTTNTSNKYEMTFKAGGNTVPYVQFFAGNAMLSIPTLDTQDVLSLNVDFKMLPYTDAGSTVALNSGNIVSGKNYQIVTLGSSTAANFVSVGATSVASNALVIGAKYIITTVGTGDFISAGAGANTVGTIFTATATTNGQTDGVVLEVWFRATTSSGTGTGAVRSRDTDLEAKNELVVSYFPTSTTCTTDTNDTN